MEIDPDLIKTVPAQDQEAARRVPLVTRHELPAGHLDTQTLITDDEMPFGVLMVEGAVCRDTALGRHSSCHLFGPGAIIRPRDHGNDSLPWETSWSCVTETTLAVLDHDFPLYLARWPELSEFVHRQLAIELEASLYQCAWTGLSRVDDRILALFWHLADVWGTVRPEGVAIPLPLTHRLIGRLVAAERATISLALSRLAARELLVKIGPRTWLLSHRSQDLLVGS
jgi:CRP-like cAMP-binding protein